MSYISFQPKDYFNTLTYSGTGGNGTTTTQAITGAGFQPDWVWLKQRTGTQAHMLCDAVRGANNILKSNSTSPAQADTEIINSFDSDGFTAGYQDQANDIGATYVSWLWKAGTTSGIATNGSTTITPSSYSFSQASGFSILKYSGNGTAGAYLAHGLGKEPHVVIAISTNLSGEPWQVYSKDLGNDKRLFLNLTNAETSASEWNSTTPDTVNIRLGDGTHINSSGNTFIAYCFAEIPGFSAFGKYEGNGNAEGGPFVYCGFKPSLVISKAKGTTENWSMYDGKRLGYNPAHSRLYPNLTTAEGAETQLDFLSNGFKVRSGGSGHLNSNGQGYFYMAFAEAPFVGTNDVPVNAR